MKTFKDLHCGDIAWILDDEFNVDEVILKSKDSYEGFTDNFITFHFFNKFDNKTIVVLHESGEESDKNWAYCNGGKIYLDKELILKKIEMKSKDINDMINYLKKENVKSEMVNKSEFIAKVKRWLELETNWGQRFDENGRNENYGKIDELIKYLKE